MGADNRKERGRIGSWNFRPNPRGRERGYYVELITINDLKGEKRKTQRMGFGYFGTAEHVEIPEVGLPSEGMTVYLAYAAFNLWLLQYPS